MQDKILARVKYWKLEVPPVEERPTHAGISICPFPVFFRTTKN